MSFLGDVNFIMQNAAPILSFLDSFWGTLAIVGIGLLLIFRAATEPHTQSGTAVSVPTPQPNPELEQLKRKLRVAEQDRNQLRALLADPTAKRRHEEEMLQRRCVQVAKDVSIFARDSRFDRYSPEAHNYPTPHIL